MERLNMLQGGPVRARDGEIGIIRDFYFDDETWTVRYMIVETGKWLPERKVLLPLWALEAPEWAQARVPVRLTRDQVKNSPHVDTDQPVSRRVEAAALGHYGYPFYWGGPALWGPVGAPGFIAGIPASPPSNLLAGEEETHLRSCNEVRGYHVKARDGEIGHVDDFMVDGVTWAIDRLLLDTSNWIGGRAVLIQPASIDRIAWVERQIVLSIPRNAVVRSSSLSR